MSRHAQIELEPLKQEAVLAGRPGRAVAGASVRPDAPPFEARSVCLGGEHSKLASLLRCCSAIRKGFGEGPLGLRESRPKIGLRFPRKGCLSLRRRAAGRQVRSVALRLCSAKSCSQLCKFGLRRVGMAASGAPARSLRSSCSCSSASRVFFCPPPLTSAEPRAVTSRQPLLLPRSSPCGLGCVAGSPPLRLGGGPA